MKKLKREQKVYNEKPDEPVQKNQKLISERINAIKSLDKDKLTDEDIQEMVKNPESRKVLEDLGIIDNSENEGDFSEESEYSDEE